MNNFDSFVLSVLESRVGHNSPGCEEMIEKTLEDPLVKHEYRMDNMWKDRISFSGATYTFFARYPNEIPDEHRHAFAQFTIHKKEASIHPLRRWLRRLHDFHQEYQSQHIQQATRIPYGKSISHF